MRIIHLFWQQTGNDFNNDGSLYLWLEQANKLTGPAGKNNKHYPYQAAVRPLASWFSEHFGRFLPVKRQTLNKKILDAPDIQQVTVQLPCDPAKQAIPSPIIANLNNLEESDVAELAPFILNVLKIDQPLAFLKELNFQSYYFESDNFADVIQLADDAKFWLKMATELSYVIQQDQYIPFLIAQKVNKKTQFQSKWQPMSADYQQRLQKIAPLMPFSACFTDHLLDKDLALDPLAVLQHFSEVTLNHLIGSTRYPNTVHKQLQDSFIESSLNFTQAQVSEEQWKAWRLWHNNLNYDQFGAPFQLCFRLKEAPQTRVWTGA